MTAEDKPKCEICQADCEEIRICERCKQPTCIDCAGECTCPAFYCRKCIDQHDCQADPLAEGKKA